MEKLINFPKNKFIYLKLDTKKSYDRIIERGRVEDVGIDYGYLDLLNIKHDEWLDNLDEKECFKINNTYNYFEDKEYFNEVIHKMIDFVKME